MSANPSAPSAPPTDPNREQRKPPSATNDVIYAFWIVGRNGGLLYSKDIQPAAAPIDFNDKLRLASSWFGMCGISAQLAPDPSNAGVVGGVHVLKADTFDLHSFQSLTGVTFMLITSPGYRGAGGLLQGDVYRLYCDYVLKNPFHEAEQVIKSELFDGKIIQLLHGVR